MRVFTVNNPRTGERDLWITLCRACDEAGRMAHLDRQPEPSLPVGVKCGFCGQAARQCEGCGCTDAAACEGGCTWIDPALTGGQNVCSVCYAMVMRQTAAQSSLGRRV